MREPQGPFMFRPSSLMLVAAEDPGCCQACAIGTPYSGLGCVRLRAHSRQASLAQGAIT